MFEFHLLPGYIYNVLIPGNGRYNYLLAATCGLVLLGMGTDMFGFGLVVAAACDLNITVTQKGILTSLPFIGELFKFGEIKK